MVSMAAKHLQMNPDKTEQSELLWAGMKYISLLSCLAAQLGYCQSSKHVHVLRVTILVDMSLNQHVSKVCAASFQRLRQLRRIRKSLDNESAATLVHTVVMSRTDYCNALCAMSPQTSSTGCKGWWTRPLELSVTLVNMIVDLRQYYMTNSTGWMYWIVQCFTSPPGSNAV